MPPALQRQEEAAQRRPLLMCREGRGLLLVQATGSGQFGNIRAVLVLRMLVSPKRFHDVGGVLGICLLEVTQLQLLDAKRSLSERSRRWRGLCCASRTRQRDATGCLPACSRRCLPDDRTGRPSRTLRSSGRDARGTCDSLWVRRSCSARSSADRRRSSRSAWSHHGCRWRRGTSAR